MMKYVAKTRFFKDRAYYDYRIVTMYFRTEQQARAWVKLNSRGSDNATIQKHTPKGWVLIFDTKGSSY